MLFNSYIFILVFLPISLVGFHLCARYAGRRAIKVWLILVSVVFYGYHALIYIPLLVASIFANYWLGRTLEAKRSRGIKGILTLGIIANLAVLGYFKYANFFIGSLNEFLGSTYPSLSIILPLAISFFTFQQIAYLIDVYRGDHAESDISDYVLFVSFFPQLIAGPIVKHNETVPQFQRFGAYGLRANTLAIGIGIFAIGLAKKVILGDTMGSYADSIFDAAANDSVITFAEAWAGAIAFSLQIYFDFSGYSDMAIGLARMVGVRLPLNFHSPYQATSIIDFWRRWHMTLSRFLRDYVYFPLGGNRKGPSRHLGNILFVMLIGGLWHGAGWTFIAWGGLHGLFIVVNHLWRKWRIGKIHSSEKVMGQILTLLLVVVAWVFFRADGFGAAQKLLSIMAGQSGIALPLTVTVVAPYLVPTMESIGFNFSGMFAGGHLGSPYSAIMAISASAAIALFAPNTQTLFSRYRPVLKTSWSGFKRTGHGHWRLSTRWATVTGLLIALCILTLGEVQVFLYFQF